MCTHCLHSKELNHMQSQSQSPPSQPKPETAVSKIQDRPIKLGELNSLIKNYVEELNHALRLAARVAEVETHLAELEITKLACTQHLNTLLAIRKDSKDWYSKLFNDRARLNSTLTATSNELKEQWEKGVEQAKWVIKYPFDHHLPRFEEPVKKSFVRSVKSCCTRGYTSTFGRYHYVPKVSYRAATLKMKELKFQLDNNSPSRTELQSRLDTLSQQEESLVEAITYIKLRIGDAQGLTEAQLAFKDKAIDFFAKRMEHEDCEFEINSSTLDEPMSCDSLRMSESFQPNIPNDNIFAPTSGSQCPLDMLVDTTNSIFEPTEVMSEPALSEPALSEPALSEPALSEPALSEPALSEPTSLEPGSSSFQEGSVIIHRKPKEQQQQQQLQQKLQRDSEMAFLIQQLGTPSKTSTVCN